MARQVSTTVSTFITSACASSRLPDISIKMEAAAPCLAPYSILSPGVAPSAVGLVQFGAGPANGLEDPRCLLTRRDGMGLGHVRQATIVCGLS